MPGSAAPRSIGAQLASVAAPALAQESSLRRLYDTAPIGLAFLSPDCRYLQLNHKMTEICGISVEAHLGRTVRECVPGLADAVEEIVRNMLLTGEPVTGIEVAGQRPDEPEQRTWLTYWHPVHGPDEAIIGVNVAAEEITERKRAEAALKLVVDELSHRTKNLMTVVMAMARQTAAGTEDIDDFLDRFADRMAGLANAHELLVRDQWNGASFADVLASQLKPFTDADRGRIRAEGPELVLRSNAVQYLGLALHELATNASKHGALSGSHGEVTIGWELDEPGQRVAFHWRERGGPPVTPPSRRGFGRVMIDQIVPRALRGEGRLDFAPEGVSWTFAFSAEECEGRPIRS